jgi:hypothetical protein
MVLVRDHDVLAAGLGAHAHVHGPLVVVAAARLLRAVHDGHVAALEGRWRLLLVVVHHGDVFLAFRAPNAAGDHGGSDTQSGGLGARGLGDD